MYKMMAIEEEHVYRSTRLPNAIVELPLSRLSPSLSPATRCAPRRGSRFCAPLVARKIPLVRGQGGPGRLGSGRSRGSPGPAAARGASAGSENVDLRAPGQLSAPRLPPPRAPSSLQSGAGGEEVAGASHNQLLHRRAWPVSWANRRTRRRARAIAG